VPLWRSGRSVEDIIASGFVIGSSVVGVAHCVSPLVRVSASCS
jgi:hypothetical protein